MQARFIINEIKQNIKGSGLSPINIGRTTLFRSYDYFMENMPECITDKTIEEFLKRNSSAIDYSKLHLFLSEPYDDYLEVKGMTNKFMLSYIENLRGPFKVEYISINDDDYYIHSYYNTKYNIGFFHIQILSTMNNEYIYFVKYK